MFGKKGGGIPNAKIGGLKKPPKQTKVGGVSSPFSNRIVPSVGGKR